MAALIEHLARWFAGGGFVERKEEHAALGAEPLLLARRMPSRGETFRRKHDPFAARLGDGVAASLFKRAHECGNAGAAWPDPGCRRQKGIPFRRVGRRGAMALDWHKLRQSQYFSVAVGEPLAP